MRWHPPPPVNRQTLVKNSVNSLTIYCGEIRLVHEMNQNFACVNYYELFAQQNSSVNISVLSLRYIRWNQPVNILSRCHLITVYGIHSSFSVIHKVGKAAIFVLLRIWKLV